MLLSQKKENNMFGLFASMVAQALAERKAFNEYIATLPDKEREELLARIAEKAKENEAHRKAIEIAEAGRARNFWGK